MSRIGKAVIPLSDKVNVTADDAGLVTVKGAKATQQVQIIGPIKIKIEGKEVKLERENDEQKTRALHGLYRSLVANAVHGVTDGWQKQLLLNGVGYRASVQGQTLELTLGFSHPIKHPIPQGIEIKVGKAGNETSVTITGADKALVGQVAADIRGYRPPEPYLGKGVRYSDEVIRRKAGKSGGK